MIKIDVISGFLGAGKTTLIKKLFESEKLKNEKVVIIENEFGEIGIDGTFLKDSGIQIKEINAGCICCSLVGDFEKSIKELAATYNPDRIIIEPSGVGKLSDILNAVGKVHGLDLKINILATVVDGGKVKIYLKNFGEFFNNQVLAADTIVIGKVDKISEDKLVESVNLVKGVNEKANIITTNIATLDADKLVAFLEEKASLRQELIHEVEEEHEHHHDDDDDDECCCGHHHHHHDHDDHDEDEDHECCCHHHHDDDDEDEEHEHHHHEHEDHDGDDDHECCCHHHHDDDDDEEEEHEHHHHEHEDHDEDDDHECCCHHHHDDDDDEEEHEHHHHDHEDGECDDPNCSCHHHHHHHGHDADEIFVSWGIETPRSFSHDELDSFLKTLCDENAGLGMILRSKGILKASDNDKWYYFDLVAGDYEIRLGEPDYTGRVVVIGSKLDEDKIAALFNKA